MNPRKQNSEASHSSASVTGLQVLSRGTFGLTAADPSLKEFPLDKSYTSISLSLS